ncbi:MAG: hypothetical protein IT371_01320 [Deltaproteobacteria bacterium]|nr:hypothetical protein [Deltaproteobacteria bacterium]
MKRLWLSASLLGLLAAGCKHGGGAEGTLPTDTEAPRETGFSQLHAFSETLPYTSLAAFGEHLYAGTPGGVIRFHRRSGEWVRLTKAQGLASDRVTAIAGHPRSGLWVATDRGISQHRAGVWSNQPVGAVPGPRVTAMVATENGVWAGGPGGLGRLADGAWRAHLPGAKITALLPDLEADGLWVGTAGEGVYRFVGGKLVAFTAAQGQVVRHVRSMARSATGALLVVGRDDQRERLAYFDGTYWTSYDVEPQDTLDWVSAVGDDLLLSAGGRVVAVRTLAPVAAPGGRSSSRAGPLRLAGSRSPVMPSRLPMPELATARVDTWFPPNPTVIVGYGREVLIGTRAAGAALYDGRSVKWYRTLDLTGDGEKLQLGCLEKTCYLAGGGRAFRYREGRFSPLVVTPEAAVVHAFLTDSAGAVVALWSPAEGRSVVMSRLAGDRFDKAFEAKLTLPPGRKGEVRFARYDLTGQLWVGLQYVDADGERRPWGVAVLRPDGNVLYHRSTLLPTEDRAAGSLALPDDVRDIYFSGEETWLATDSGACRVRSQRVDLFTENEGMESELLYAIDRGPAGELLAATQRGLGRYDGRQWRFGLADALSATARAVVRRGGAVWVGTDAGLVRWEGGKTLRITSVHGLAGDGVRDLRVDLEGRLWVLTSRGLSIVTP